MFDVLTPAELVTFCLTAFAFGYFAGQVPIIVQRFGEMAY